MKKLIFLCVLMSVFAFGDEARATSFMQDFRIVFNDEFCEKAVKRYYINCPKNGEKDAKCEKFLKEKTECIDKHNKIKKD